MYQVAITMNPEKRGRGVVLVRAIRARKLLPLSREITLFPYLNEPRERASERTNGGRVSTRYRMFAFSLGRLRHPTEILKKLFLPLSPKENV